MSLCWTHQLWTTCKLQDDFPYIPLATRYPQRGDLCLMVSMLAAYGNNSATVGFVMRPHLEGKRKADLPQHQPLLCVHANNRVSFNSMFYSIKCAWFWLNKLCTTFLHKTVFQSENFGGPILDINGHAIGTEMKATNDVDTNFCDKRADAVPAAYVAQQLQNVLNTSMILIQFKLMISISTF